MKKIVPIILVILIVVGFVFGSTYNKLMNLEEDINNSWAQVENTMKRRADLIPNLVNTVKGYAEHESSVLTEITKARSAISDAETPEDYAKANAEMDRALTSVNLVVEAYPELKADQNFQNLQTELAGSENRISTERKRYNDVVSEYNRTVKKFPTNIAAGILGFREIGYFEISEQDSKVPEVNF